MIADRYDAFLFDLDGVLLPGSDPCRGAPEALGALRALGQAHRLRHEQLRPHARGGRGAPAGRRRRRADADEVETSALTTAALLAEPGCRTRAFVVGEEGLREALTEAQASHVVDGEPDAGRRGRRRVGPRRRLRRAPHGLGARAARRRPGRDEPRRLLPGGRRHRWPGAGALLAAIETTTGVRGEVIGKPNAPLLRAALERAGGGRPLVIGDRLDTDIAGPRACGWDSLLVLTGIIDARRPSRGAGRPDLRGDDLVASCSPTGRA